MCKGFIAELNAQLKVILELQLIKANAMKLNRYPTLICSNLSVLLKLKFSQSWFALLQIQTGALLFNWVNYIVHSKVSQLDRLYKGVRCLQESSRRFKVLKQIFLLCSDYYTAYYYYLFSK